MDFIPAAFFLLIGFVYVIVLRKAVSSALAHGERFPGFQWRATESWISIAVAGFFVLTAAIAFGREPAKIDLRALESSLALYGGIVVFLVGALVSRNVPLVEAFGLKPASWGRLGWMTVFALGLSIPAVFAAQWAAYALLGPETTPQPIVEFLMENPGWRERLAVALIAVVAAPLTEELVFRGCLYGVARQRLGRLTTILGTSLVFALIHAHVATIPALFVLAVGLALLYEATGSLWAPILAHAAFNGLNVLASLYWPEMLQ
jgi:membrane protease YdiL (CAAX protease family)